MKRLARLGGVGASLREQPLEAAKLALCVLAHLAHVLRPRRIHARAAALHRHRPRDVMRLYLAARGEARGCFEDGGGVAAGLRVLKQRADHLRARRTVPPFEGQHVRDALLHGGALCAELAEHPAQTLYHIGGGLLERGELVLPFEAPEQVIIHEPQHRRRPFGGLVGGGDAEPL